MNWATKSLAQLCSPRRELEEPSADGTNRYVGLEHLDPGWISIRRWGSDREVCSTKSRFHRGDVLYGKLRPYLDKAALAEWGGVCSTDILTLAPDLEEADPWFLALLLHTRTFLDHAIATTSGVNHPRTSWQEISRFSSAVPPVPEQRGIAGVLAKIQRAVEVEDKRITALKELKAATMAKVFREGLRGEPVKESEIGAIPRSWSVTHLGNLIVRGPQNGLYKPASEYGIGSPIVRIDTFDQEGELSTLDFRRVRLTPDEVRTYGLSPGEILINRVNSLSHLGKSLLVPALPETTVYESNMMRFGVDEDRLRPDYLALYLLSPAAKSHFLATAKPAVAQASFNQGDLGSLRIPLPPTTAEQREISGLAGVISARYRAAARSVRGHEELFHAALAQLMTGQLRVTPLLDRKGAPDA